MGTVAKEGTPAVRGAVAVCMLVLVCALPCPARASGAADLFQLSFEEALDLTVYSVSKQREDIMLAPSAVYTLTAEDIRFSGAKKITDVFRMIPGVDVADVNSFISGVQARGFSFIPKYSRQMLVLIDGRTVYSPQINATFWDQIPLFLEDIDRIEVVRGPNAALYGANAFNGVINIITRKAADTPGGLVSVTAGNRESLWSTARYGGSEGSLDYRITAGYHTTEGFSGVHDRIRKPQVTLRTDYAPDRVSRLSFHGGYVGGDREVARRVDPEVTSYYLMLHYDRKIGERNTLSARYYHDYRNSVISAFGHDDKIRQDDAEIQFNRSGDRYRLVCGLGYRVDRVRNGMLSGADYRDYLRAGPRNLRLRTRYHRTLKAFVNATWHLSDAWHLTGALMAEGNDFVDTMYSPKVALVYQPHADHSLRAGISRAWRTPSFIEEYADFSVPAPFAPGYLGQQGNPRLDPERINAIEMGYRGRFLGQRLHINLEAFYHSIKDVILYRENEPGIYRYENARDNHVRGIEASAAWKVTPRWRLTLAGTLQQASDRELKGLVVQQKYMAGSRVRLPGDVTVNAQLYWVDRMRFERDAWVPKSTVKDYTRLDVRISKAVWGDTLEIALIGQNLLDPRHYEYSPTLNAGEANRLFLVEVTYRFMHK